MITSIAVTLSLKREQPIQFFLRFHNTFQPLYNEGLPSIHVQKISNFYSKKNLNKLNYLKLESLMRNH